MKDLRKRCAVCVLLSGWLLAGCDGGPPPTPRATPSEVPSATPTHTATPSPTPTPRLTDTDTPTPTATPTVTPTNTPAPTFTPAPPTEEVSPTAEEPAAGTSAAAPPRATGGEVTLTVQNDAQEVLQLSLRGPASYDFGVPPETSQEVSILGSAYEYTAQLGGGSASGSKDLLAAGTQVEGGTVQSHRIMCWSIPIPVKPGKIVEQVRCMFATAVLPAGVVS